MSGIPRRLPRRRLRAALRDEEGELAAAVWIAAVVYCAILAAASAGIALTIGAVSDLSAGFVIFGVFFVVLAAAFGTVVGAVAGVPLGLLVAFGQRRLGVRAVAAFIPVVAMLLTAAVIFIRLRMIEGSSTSFSMRLSVKRATFSGSKSAKARR